MVATVVELRSSAMAVTYYERDGYYAKNDPEHRQASFWYGVRQANWCECSWCESNRKEKVSHHFHPESWAAAREGGGQALTGARAGGAIEHRKKIGPGCRGFPVGRRPYLTHRYGEGGPNPAVSENPRTYVRTPPGPGRSLCHPAGVVAGSLTKGGVRNGR